MAIHVFVQWEGMRLGDHVAQEAPLAEAKVGHLILPTPWHPVYTLCPENRHERETVIPAIQLRQRLPETLRLLENLMRVHLYASDEQTADVLGNLHDLVAFCEAKEKETGQPVMIMTLDN
jgi:hypothetical protein